MMFRKDKASQTPDHCVHCVYTDDEVAYYMVGTVTEGAGGRFHTPRSYNDKIKKKILIGLNFYQSLINVLCMNSHIQKKILFHFQMVLKIISAQKIPCMVWTISLILLSYKLLCGVDRSKRYQYWLSVNLSVPLIF